MHELVYESTCLDCGTKIETEDVFHEDCHRVGTFRSKQKKKQYKTTARRKRRFRRKMFIQQNGYCGICYERLGDPLSLDVNVDHIIPRARGGTNHPDNLQLVHEICNTEKGSKVDEHYVTTTLQEWEDDELEQQRHTTE